MLKVDCSDFYFFKFFISQNFDSEYVLFLYSGGESLEKESMVNNKTMGNQEKYK